MIYKSLMPLSTTDWFVLFAKREQEVFGESPVEEGADLRIDIDDFQAGKLADHGARGFGGGHETVFRVEIHKHIEHVSRLCALGDVTARKENAGLGAVVEEKTGGGFAEYAECIAFANVDHVAVTIHKIIRRWEKMRQGKVSEVCAGIVDTAGSG